MVTGTAWRIPRRNGRSPGSRRLRGALIRTSARSVSRRASPRPGKCFIVATARPSWSPSAKSPACKAVFSASNDQVRPWRYTAEARETGTSATGARSTLIPSARSAVPVHRPCSRAREPMVAGATDGGAHETVFTLPPSWSTAINSLCRPPAAAATCSERVIRRNPSLVRKLNPWTITPPTSPRRTRAKSEAVGAVPCIVTTSFCPTSCASVGRVASRAGPAPAETTSARHAAAAALTSELDAQHVEHPSPLGDLAVAHIRGAHTLVEPVRVRLGLPLEPPGAELARAADDVLEQESAHSAADPGRIDPEILEPADLAAGDQRGPPDRRAFGLRDVHLPGPHALGVEVTAQRPVLYLPAVVAPVRLGVDRDLAQPRNVTLGSRADHHDAHRATPQTKGPVAGALRAVR